MSRFNFNSRLTAPSLSHNFEGAPAFRLNPKAELVSILLTSFAADQYYRTSDDAIFRLKTLVRDAGLEFSAKAAVFARREFGMRSVSHIVAGLLSVEAAGSSWLRDFFRAVIIRPDDMLEIAAFTMGDTGAEKLKLPAALKAVIRERLATMSPELLAKYQHTSKEIKMVDLMNLTHPSGDSLALRLLAQDKLRNENTWEARLSEAGSAPDMQAEAWVKLLTEKKVGYLALLRNARNIAKFDNPELTAMLCEGLADEGAITKKPVVFPFQIQSAIKHVDDPRVIVALNRALEISLANVPKFSGKTIVVVDNSGSMHGIKVSRKSSVAPIDIATLMGAALFRTNGADVMMFGTGAAYVTLNPGDTVTTIAAKMKKTDVGWATCLSAAFQAMGHRPYDRVIVISDMQAYDLGSDQNFRTVFENWVRTTKSDPFVFSFDLAGYGTTQFSGNKVLHIPGFNSKVFEIMIELEKSPDEMIKAIESLAWQVR